MALRDGCGTSIGVIAACFARVLRGYSGRACMGFLLILQEVRRVSKTRNKFYPWPEERELMRQLFEAVARAGAILAVYHTDTDIRVFRKV